MKTHATFTLSLLALAGFTASAPGVLAGGADTSSASAADIAHGQLPMDLARGSVGAQIQVRGPKSKAESADEENRSAQALISDDASLGYPLMTGATSMIVSLPKIEVLSRFNFISFDAGGQVTVSASSVKLPFDSPDWRAVSRDHAFKSQEVVACPLGSIEARYLKFDFKTNAAGRIASLGLYGLSKISNFKVQPGNADYPVAGGIGRLQTRGAFFDYANLYTGASVVATSDGRLDQAQGAIAGDPEKGYAFSPTDPAPTMVVDLGVRRRLSRVSCVYSATPGTFDVYLVDNPKTTENLQRVNLSYVGAPQAGGADRWGISASDRQPLMSVDTSKQPGLTHASADLSGKSGRFLIAEFHPTAKQHDFKDFKDTGRDFKDSPHDFKDTAGDFKDGPAVANTDPAPVEQEAPFKVLAFSAFGDNPHDQVITRLPDVPYNTGGGGNTPPNFPPTPGGSSTISQ